MKLLVTLLSNILKYFLFFVGLLALGSGMGYIPCIIGLSAITQMFRLIVHGLAFLM